MQYSADVPTVYEYRVVWTRLLLRYIDNILVASTSPEENLQHLKLIFDRSNNYGLTINPTKSVFGITSVQYLGYHTSEDGIQPLPEKVRVIMDMPKPKTIVELRRFLGTINFYRKFIKHGANFQAPFNEFLQNAKRNDKRPIPWTQHAEEVFLHCKSSLANNALLVHPKADTLLCLTADASDVAIGAVLKQIQQNEL